MANVVLQNSSELVLDGDLTFMTIKPLYQKLNAVFSPEADVTVDLKNVAMCDSASLVLLLSIVQRAEQHKFAVQFTHIPQNLLMLIRLYKLTEIIKSSAS